MKKTLFTITACFFILTIHRAPAQNPNEVDSLESLLNSDLTERQRVDVLIALTDEVSLDYDQVKNLVEEAITLSNSIGYKEGRVLAKGRLGRSYYTQSEFEAAYGQYQMMLDEAIGIEFDLGIAQAYFGKGRAGFNLSLIEESFSDLFKSVDYFQKTADIEGLALAYEVLADNYYYGGEFKKALSFNQLALDHYSQVNGDLAGVYNTYGMIYGDLNNEAKALEYFLLAMEAGGGINEAPTYTIHNIALVYSFIEENEKALFYLKKALEREENTRKEIDLILDDKKSIAEVYHDMGEHEIAHQKMLEILPAAENQPSESTKAYIYTGVASSYMIIHQYDSAINYFLKAIEIENKLGERVDEAITCNDLASTYLKKGDYLNAKKYALHALEVSEQVGHPAGILVGNEVLSEAEAGLKNYQKAFEARLLFDVMTDSLRNEEQTKTITRLNAEFEFEQEKDSIAFAQEKIQLGLEQEIEKRKTINQAAIGAGALVLIILILLYRSYLIKQRKNLELHHKNEMIASKNNELISKNEEIMTLRDTEKKMSEESLALKERELTNITMLSHEKNELLQQIGNQIGKIGDKVDEKIIPDLKEIKQTIKSNISNESWNAFTYHFEQVHPEFFNKLKESYDELNQNDLRLCAYIKVGLNNKVIAQMNNITLAGVKKNINRLKKKLELEADDSLRDFMMKFI